MPAAPGSDVDEPPAADPDGNPGALKERKAAAVTGNSQDTAIKTFGAAVIFLVALGSGFAQLVLLHNGWWWLLSLAGAAFTFTGYWLSQQERRHWGFACGVVGTVLVVVSVLVALGWAIDDPKATTTSKHQRARSGASSSATGSSPTTSTPAPTGSATGGSGGSSTGEQPVSLSLSPVTDGISVVAKVQQLAPASHHYWLVLKVRYSARDVEYYGQGRIVARAGASQTVPLQLPADADLSLQRTALVWDAPPFIDTLLERQQQQPLLSRVSIPVEQCSCDAAVGVQVTPRR